MIPPIVERLMGHLMAKGMGKDEAQAAAIAHLQKSGVLKPGTLTLSDVGKVRNAMTPAQRAGVRALPDFKNKNAVPPYKQARQAVMVHAPTRTKAKK